MAASSEIYGMFAGGTAFTSSAFVTNTVDYVTIASTGNATDFGDLATVQNAGGGCSNAHGGL